GPDRRDPDRGGRAHRRGDGRRGRPRHGSADLCPLGLLVRVFRGAARRAGSVAVSVLSHSRAAEALKVYATRPLTSTLAAIQIGDNRFEYPSPRSAMYGVEDDVALRAVVWAGANIIPVATTPAQRPAIAERIVARGQAASSLLGDADEVLS